ncbi:MAG: response regulator [Vicinamibacterales bacterium]
MNEEPSILDGFQDLLHKQRHLWEMVFSLGEAAALAELQKGPFDVVVTDMRLPGLQGAAFLTAVKEAYPHIARIALSGQAEREALLKALPVAHHLLTKPCDGELLRIVIERACRLQRLLHDETIRKAVGRLENLPSSATIYRELTQALSDPDVGLAAVAAVVEKDPAISAKVLQLVNSAYFGLSRRVTSILQATVYLGSDTIRGLVLTSQIFSLLDRSSALGLSIERLQQHSLMTARLAKQLVRNQRVADDAFTAGLLHDIGQIALAVCMREQFARVLWEVRSTGRPLHEVECEQLGVSHAEVGAYLLGIWGLPFSVVEAVAYHHRPSLIGDGDREALAAVHVADALLDMRDEIPSAEAGLDTGFLECSGWSALVPTGRALMATAFATAPEAPATRPVPATVSEWRRS